MKKNILRTMTLIFVLFSMCISLLGCKKETINEEKKYNIETQNVYLDVGKYNIYLPDVNVKKVDIQNIMNELIEKNKNLKGFIVYFYDQQGECYYNDINPYAIGIWSSENSYNKIFNQLSNKNNKLEVEFSSVKSVEYSDEEIKQYNQFLLDNKTNSNSFDSLVNFDLLSSSYDENKYGINKEEMTELLNKISNRYGNDIVELYN